MEHLENVFPALGGPGFLVTSPEDIQHQLEDLAGTLYGQCACFLRRANPVAD